MANSRKQSASLLTVVVVFSLFIIAGLAVGGAVTNAEWKGSSGVPALEAVGTVIAKNQAEAPKSTKGAEHFYLKVDFATDDGTLFVIPFRFHDMEAIPIRYASARRTRGRGQLVVHRKQRVPAIHPSRDNPQSSSGHCARHPSLSPMRRLFLLLRFFQGDG